MRRLLAASAALLLGGCVRHSAPIVSTTSIGAYEWPVGLGAGTSTGTYIFGIGPIGDDSVGQAVARAIGHDGDALVNTTIDRRTTYIPAPFLPIVTRVETRVFGTVVVYIDDDGNEVLRPGANEALEQTSAAAAPPAATFLGAAEPDDDAPAPVKPVVWVRDGLATEDFLQFFRGLRRGAALDVRLADGRRMSGNFGRLEKSGRNIRIGNGFFGSKAVAIDAIEELRSQTIRGESIRLRRQPK